MKSLDLLIVDFMWWLVYLKGRCWKSDPDRWNYDASYQGEDESGSHWDQSAICPNCKSESFTIEGDPWIPNYFSCYDCEHESQRWAA